MHPCIKKGKVTIFLILLSNSILIGNGKYCSERICSPAMDVSDLASTIDPLISDTLVLDSAFTYHIYPEFEDRNNGFKNIHTYDEFGRKICTQSSRFKGHVIWIPSHKEEMSYDIQGNKERHANYYWDSYDSDWKGERRNDYIFFKDGKPKANILYEWDDKSNSWIASDRREFVYDEQGSRIDYSSIYNSTSKEWEYTSKSFTQIDGSAKNIFYRYSKDTESNEWVEESRTETHRNEDGKSNRKYRFEYNGDLNEMIEVSRSEALYDSLGNLSSTYSIRWNGILDNRVGYKKEELFISDNSKYFSAEYIMDTSHTEWFQTMGVKWESLYDQQMNGRIFVSHKWDKDCQKWEGDDKKEITYIGKKKIKEQIEYKWDLLVANWVEARKKEIDYYADGQVSLIEDFIWNNRSENWENSEKIETVYDTISRIKKENWFQWDTTLSNWILVRSHEIEKNTEDAITSELWNVIVSKGKRKKGRFKTIINYDDTGNEILRMDQIWDADVSIWIGKNKKEWVHCKHGETFFASYHWDKMNNVWIGEMKYRNNFDENGKRISDESYKWDYMNNDWLPEYLHRSTSEINDSLIIETHFSDTWNIELEDWEYQTKKVNITDRNGNVVSQVKSLWDKNEKKWMETFIKKNFYSIK